MAALVNSWTSPFPGLNGTWGNGYYDGLGVLETVHSSGNLLVAFVGWANIDDTAANPVSPVPVSNVADDAHNFWIPLVTSSQLGNYRCAIWVCPNARQGDAAAGLTRISVSLTARAFLLGFKVVEFSGMPLVATLSGMENSAFSNSASSINVTGTTTGATWGFAMSVGRVPTVGTPSSPWTTITEFDPVSRSGTTMALAMSWGNLSSGAQSVTFAPPGSGAIAACLGGILQTAVVPVLPNPNRPLIKTEAAFGHQAGDVSTMPVWTDISAYAKQPSGESTLATGRGKSYELTSPEAGDGQIWLDNHTGDWNPLNTSSPLYPNVRLGLPVRTSAFWNNRWHWIMNIQAKQLPQQFPDPQWGFSPLTGYDAMGVLANADLLSAYKQEILTDNPYAYWPLGESYTQANGLPFGNLAPGNQRPMVGIDGGSDSSGAIISLATGQTLGLNGDINGGIGIGSISSSPHNWSAGAFCIDPNFPQYNTASGITVEFWGILPQPSSGSAVIPFVTLIGSPSNWATSNYGPARMQLTWESLGFGTVFLAVADTNGSFNSGSSSALLTSANPHHFIIHISGSTNPITDLYVDGALLINNGTMSGVSSSGDIQGIVVGPATEFCPGIVANNYSIGQVAVYSGKLTADRIIQHYQAGVNAFTGESALTRFSHLMTWGQTGIPMAGDKGSAAPLLGYCDTIEGQSVSDAVSDIVASEGGSVYAGAEGAVFYQSRQALYNKTPKYTFGDNPAGGEVPYLPGQSFDADIIYLFNRVRAQRQVSQNQVTTTVGAGKFKQLALNDGALVLDVDTASETQYAPRAILDQTILTSSDQDAYDWTGWKLNKYKDQAYRVPQIKLDPLANPAIWDVALTVEQGDVVKVIRRPLGAPSYTVLCVVQEVDHAGGPEQHDVTLALSPYTIESNVLQLDNGSLATLASNRIGW